MKKIIDNTYTIITGATGGLGKAFVFELAKSNQNMILVATNKNKLNDFKKEILEDYSNLDIVTCKCDYTLDEDVEKLLELINSKKYNINCLINNAGYICEGSTKFSSTETLENCIKVNNLTTVKLTKCLLDNKEINNHLNIITISSLASFYPLPYMAIYSASKAFLKNYMLAIRNEYSKDNVNILVVLPGAIATSESMKQAIQAQGLKGKLSAVPTQKIAKNSLKKVKKNKSTYIPGFFNKLTYFVSNITPMSIQIKVAGKMWKKSQAKRNIK